MALAITIIGGYLGAGKTTLVNHLLRQANGLRIAVLVNEFGELPIDQDLIEAQDKNMISIAGGCVCCSYGNDLTLALLDLAKLDPLPEHILLEASGVALPGAIASSVSLLPDYAVDGVVVIVDAETIQEQAADTYIGDTITRQLDSANLVVMNKTDLLENTKKFHLETWLRDKVPNAELVVANHGVLPPHLVLQSFLSQSFLSRAYSPNNKAHQTELFSTLSFAVDLTVNADWLAEALAAKSLGLIRAKGFVYSTAGQLMTVQVVGRRWAVSAAPEGASTGLVVIGHENNLDPEVIKARISQAASYC